MAFDLLSDAIIVFCLNVALISGCFWVLLRFLEQCIRVWRLTEEKQMRAPVSLIKRLAWLSYLKNKGLDVEEALEAAHKKLSKFWQPNVKEEK